MRKLVYYVAASLDGFIAAPGGGFDFFPFEGELAATVMAEFPETLPVQARLPLGLADVPHRRFDTVVMGRATYEPALKLGITSPYGHLRQYVFSRSLVSDDVNIVATDPGAFVRDLKSEEGLDIWLCGGASLAGQLLPEIDELIIKRNAVLLGTGIPLFDAPFAPRRFERTGNRPLEGGVTIETYVPAAV